MSVIVGLAQLLVVLETREEDDLDVVQVVGVFSKPEHVPAPRPGWTRNVVNVFQDVVMCSPAFRFHPRAPADDSEATFLAEAASRCQCCETCHQQVPCAGVTQGASCDALCTCDRDNDARYEDGYDGDDT